MIFQKKRTINKIFYCCSDVGPLFLTDFIHFFAAGGLYLVSNYSESVMVNLSFSIVVHAQVKKMKE